VCVNFVCAICLCGKLKIEKIFRQTEDKQTESIETNTENWEKARDKETDKHIGTKTFCNERERERHKLRENGEKACVLSS
jgi:hypothetical protein